MLQRLSNTAAAAVLQCGAPTRSTGAQVRTAPCQLAGEVHFDLTGWRTHDAHEVPFRRHAPTSDACPLRLSTYLSFGHKIRVCLFPVFFPAMLAAGLALFA